MSINTNGELSQTVAKIIKDSGVKKTWLASKIGMTRQGLDKLLQKQSFSIDDANKILNVFNMSVSAQINNE